MKRLTLSTLLCCAAALVLCPLPDAAAQDQTPLPQGVSRGENFSAGKAPAALFASDCTGAGCHKGPQGLGKSAGIGGLAGFLREHYTNSRESAAALANYLLKMPSGPEPREARTPPRPGKPAAAASGTPNWGEALGFPSGEKPAHGTRQQPGGRASRAAARTDDEPAATPPVPPVAAPGVAPPPAHTAAQRGRQPAATAAAPLPPAELEAAPAPPSPQKQYDIFD